MAETATTIFSAGGTCYRDQITVTTSDGQTHTWPGPVYVLPQETYKALFLAE